MKPYAIIFLALLFFVLAGCSAPFTYEAVEWRIAIDGPSDASALVTYSGVGLDSRKEVERVAAIEKLKEFAADETPDSPLSSELSDVRRKVYLQDNKVVVEETGKIRNPLSWFVQTGLNPLSWFDDSINLTINRNHIIKNVDFAESKILATSGQMMDMNSFTTLLKGEKLLPIKLNSNSQWQTKDREPIEEEIFPGTLHVIVWPRAAKSFYWKLSGSSTGKDWQSLAKECKNKN